MEQLNDDSSSIRHGSTTEPSGTEPSVGAIHHASLLLSPLVFLPASSAGFSKILARRAFRVLCCRQRRKNKLKSHGKGGGGEDKQKRAQRENEDVSGYVCVLYVMEGETAGKVNGNPAAVDLIPS